MKKIHFVLILFSIINCYSQNKRAATLIYSATRIYTPSIVNREQISVYVADDFIISKTQFLEKNETNKGEIIDDMTIFIDNESDIKKFNEIGIDLNNKTLTEYISESFVLNDYFAIQEPLPVMKWELKDEQKQIGDFLCEKAKTTFRGRTYEVWYTTEIPITYGPWKFNGLPGLMVEIKDKQDIYTWQLTSIKNDVEIDFNLKSISEKNKKFKPFTYKDYDSFWLNKRIELDKMKISRIDSEYKISLSFSTETNREPINEWRTQTQWETSN